jgi:hypothetical protein
MAHPELRFAVSRMNRDAARIDRSLFNVAPAEATWSKSNLHMLLTEPASVGGFLSFRELLS